MAYQPKSYRKFVAAAATATLVASAIAPVAGAASNFEDVAPKYQAAVDYLVANGITQGTSDTTFGTHDNVKRGDLAIWLVKALKLDTTNAPASGFSDTGSRYDAAVSVLKSKGIISGKTATTFAPSASVTRGEMAIMLSNAYDLKSDVATKFTDAVGNYTKAIQGLFAYGVTTGKSDTMFGTSMNITRGDLAIFLKRAAEAIKTPVITGVKLNIEVSDTDATLTANGADNTIVTITATRNGKVDEAFKGTVKFQSLKGATFAKETVAFDKGVAKVQLNSMSSPVEIVDTIIATIADAEDDNLVGVSTKINVKYVPVDGNQQTNDKVFVTYAESQSASEVFVRFNKDFDFAALYKDKANLRVNGKVVLDVLKLNSNTVKLVVAESDALTDNSAVKVSTFNNLTTGAFIDSEYTFNLVDPKAPEAVKVSTPDFKTVVAEFTEPVTSNTAGDITNWVLNGKKLASTDGTVTVGAYDLKNHVDNRNLVTLTLNSEGLKKLKAAGSNNLLQAYNVTDFAGLSDKSGQNKATTQEFVFTTLALPGAPTAAITQQSPEQFKVAFSSEVSSAVAGKTVEDLLKVQYQDGLKADKTAQWADLTLGTDYTVTKGTDAKTYYVELKQDWTVIHNTATTKENYYTPDFNKVKISLATDVVMDSYSTVKAKAIEQTLDLALDATAPTFTAKQVVSTEGNPQALVEVTMSEPVKFNVGNTEGATASQQQSGVVPTPTFEFVSADQKTTIEGTLAAGSLAEDDMTFKVAPKDVAKLTAGEWTLYIRSISDDVGNTSNTLAQKLTIVAAKEDTGKAQIIWAETLDNVDVNNDSKADTDIVTVQFGTEMSLDALRSNIYTINGKVLPEGVSITSAEVGYNYTTGTDSAAVKGTRVVIELPKNFLGDTSETVVETISVPHILNVNKRLADAKNSPIIGATEVQMTYDFDGASTVGRPLSATELLSYLKIN